MCSCNKNKAIPVYSVNQENIVTITQINRFTNYLNCALNRKLEYALGIPVETITGYIDELNSDNVLKYGKQPSQDTVNALKMIIPVLISYGCN